MDPKRRIVVVSAPSGTGKTTLNRRLVTEHPTVALSVSYTTRQRRAGEQEGVDYHYVSEASFREQIDKGDMLEYAEVFGTLYGTPIAEIERIQNQGKIPLLEIDVQGWRQARTKLTNAASVFILPPSIEILWKRLEGRATESKDVRWKRLMTSRAEIASGNLYESFVVNRDLEDAYQQLQDIVLKGKKGRMSRAEGLKCCQDLLEEFDQAPWLQKLSRELADKKGS